ncbi:cell division protein SepF [Mycolicibacterium neoaurum]|uniref:Cell division protein SepF n=1 Tax=Mycolicibacterium neoaurum TaxID=1795 RepID=A0AAV2WLE2_MYCNE|nr:cell division protein SepF [Mycolicibacterium neoaurum]QVI30212.1 cell division protein SepF [Mycolicibacterium neoaurum]TLH48647.1 cell division protein SepF [Mycolicibacterium neoaurum]CDQ45051.1 Cell division protein SepF [Mycolicibacterium neoaurum]SDD39202.1 cell division inhibitor SepF [Mycolicibacterium neoaurum]
MSTLHKVKAYFGMAPMDDYDDEYYDDERPARGGYPRRGAEDRFDEDGYGREGRDPRDARGFEDRVPAREYDDIPGAYRGGYGDAPRFEGRLRAPRPEFDRPAPRFAAPTRGASALAMEPRRMAALFEEGSPLAKITTLRPKDYSEARTIGERFRDGTPVIMDLVSMDNADAKRLVDFAAGLAFALRGSFDKVATKVFLLSPADIDVSAEERRRIAEAGFYAYQ